MARRTRAPVWVLAVLVAISLGVGRGSQGSGGAPVRDAAPPAPQPQVVGAGSTLQLLATLKTKGRAPTTGFRRSAFGPAWVDVDRNGCRTRDDVLARDLRQVQRRDGCVVVAGTLLDPYTHEAVEFRRSDAAAVQVDHVVSLSDAWQTGAQQWARDKRVAFANDPLELLAVGAAVNGDKGGADAASWLPPYQPFRCAFVTRQVQVKAKYGLWVTAAERAAIRRVLAGCR